jgi:SnoaL-like domain
MTAAEVIAAFARARNTEDDTERLGLLITACPPDAVFAAPQGETCGVEALSASIGEFRRVFPAAAVSFGVPDGHGDFARVAWTTHWNNGQPPLTGEDFARLAEDGRIRLLVSFDGATAASR